VIAHRLRNGAGVNVRPISHSDADGLVRFHESLSTESQRSRFFAIHPHLSLKEVELFTNVDHRDRQAFVAVVNGEIVGVGRYDRLDGRDAEVAFVTRDDHQGLGIATLLFQELVTAASALGITRFVAETLPENHKMLDLFTRTGLVSRRSYGRGVVELTMSLPSRPNRPNRLTAADRLRPAQR
jgi:RimJ/RimL family protein N-acetyltransferase